MAEAAEFRATHDLGDYEDQLTEVSGELNLQRRTFLIALEPELAKKLSAYAATQGVATETLINLWLRERLAAATSRR